LASSQRTISLNKIVLDLKEYWELIELSIANGGEFRLYHKGISMMPLLRQGVDSVVLVSPDNIKKYDIVMYRRDNGDMVMHRIVKMKSNQLTMCGDNHFELEKGIRPEQVLAKVKGIYRGEEYVDIENNKRYKKYLKKLPFIRWKKKHIDVLVDHWRNPEKRKHFKKKK